MSVAIIGAGPSGLTTAKSMIEQGIYPTIFERGNKIGGIWRLGLGNVWTSMHTNVSKYLVSFSDYPWPAETQLFPSAHEVQDYLNGYVEKFHLEKYLRLSSTVTMIQQLHENQKWLIKWKNENNEEYSELFNFVVVSTGAFTNEFIPENENKNLYKGKILHSIKYHSFRENDNLNGKKILVVGHSLSAIDICTDLAKKGAHVFNVFNRPYWIAKRFAKLNPLDLTEHEVPIDFLIFNRKIENDIKELKKNKDDENVFKNKMMSKLCPEQNEYEDLYIDPESKKPVFVALSDEYIDFVKDGKIRIKKGKIKSFTSYGVVLEDKTFIEAAVVLYCTGYHLKLDFIEKHILDKIEYNPDDTFQPIILYKSTFHPDVKNFVCVGMNKEPAYPIIELQGKWASLVFSGKIQLPSLDIMYDEMKEERAFRTMLNKPQTPHLECLNKFADDIAMEINLAPDVESIKQKNPEIFKAFWEGPLCAVHFKLFEHREMDINVLNEINDILNGHHRIQI